MVNPISNHTSSAVAGQTHFLEGEKEEGRNPKRIRTGSSSKEDVKRSARDYGFLPKVIWTNAILPFLGKTRSFQRTMPRGLLNFSVVSKEFYRIFVEYMRLPFLEKSFEPMANDIPLISRLGIYNDLKELNQCVFESIPKKVENFPCLALLFTKLGNLTTEKENIKNKIDHLRLDSLSLNDIDFVITLCDLLGLQKLPNFLLIVNRSIQKKTIERHLPYLSKASFEVVINVDRGTTDRSALMWIIDNRPDLSKYIPLIAARAGDVDVFKWLDSLENGKGAPLFKSKTEDGKNVAEVAIENEQVYVLDWLCRYSIGIDLLLEEAPNGDPTSQLIHTRERRGDVTINPSVWVAQFAHCYPELGMPLLEKKNKIGWNNIHVAAKWRDCDFFMQVVVIPSFYPYIQSLTEDGWNAALIAAKFGNLSFLKLLGSNSVLESMFKVKTRDGKNIEQIAYENNRVDVLMWLRIQPGLRDFFQSSDQNGSQLIITRARCIDLN